MFARCTQLIAFSTALFAVSGSLALARNFSDPRQGPQIVNPQRDPPSLLNPQYGQFNGQYGQPNNGPAPADVAPRLNPQHGQQQLAQPQFAAPTPQTFQQQHQEIVEFRLITTKTMHAPDENTARQFHAALLQLGCEARLDGHGDHFDLSYRCVDWKRAQFADHASAHKWETWLRSLGFEVSHQH